MPGLLTSGGKLGLEGGAPGGGGPPGGPAGGPGGGARGGPRGGMPPGILNELVFMALSYKLQKYYNSPYKKCVLELMMNK